MSKEVCYAYATSSMANQLRRFNDGCWFVKIDGNLYGPFDTVEEAESAAQGEDATWDRNYLRYPLLGSHFNTPGPLDDHDEDAWRYYLNQPTSG